MSERIPWLVPTSLYGRQVNLRPLRLDDVSGLVAAATDGELWNLFFTSVPRPEGMQAYVQAALADQAAGAALPFCVCDANGQIVGSTRFGHIDALNRRVEIGWTWYAKRVQRTGLNTEAKFLLLSHTFETLFTAAVELRTSWMNHASRAAIARLGAKQDGVLRNHMRLPDGGYRDTVVYSIIESEWPAVKQNLQWLMSKHGDGA